MSSSRICPIIGVIDATFVSSSPLSSLNWAVGDADCGAAAPAVTIIAIQSARRYR